jgi:hypothetical protein
VREGRGEGGEGGDCASKSGKEHCYGGTLHGARMHVRDDTGGNGGVARGGDGGCGDGGAEMEAETLSLGRRRLWRSLRLQRRQLRR